MDDGARSAPNHRRHLPLQEAGGELVELLWQDGAVVAQPQPQTPHRRYSQSGVTGDDAAAWLIPDGGGGRDLYSQLWHGIADADAAHGDAGALVAGGGAGSSFCGSNVVTAPALLPSPEEEPGSSSAGGHALPFKRSRDELDSRGEDADDCEAVDETRPSRRPAAKRRTRAADVHNLSERRRRDRINEKMKALQELVPHCNKVSDKASILDDAIEYLKSLQLQVQIMWMTTGMAPMMFPGGQQLMPPMAMGLNPGCMPAAQSLSQLQRVAPFMNNPLPNQMPQVQSPGTNSPNVTNQMQNNGICEPRNPFLHPNDTLAAAAAQVPVMFPYGSQPVQHNEAHELLGRTATPASGARPPCSSDGTGEGHQVGKRCFTGQYNVSLSVNRSP